MEAFCVIPRHIGRGAVAAAAALLLVQGAWAAGMRISGPSVVEPGQSYVLTVEAENTGLGGQPTDGAQWRVVAPSCLVFDRPVKPDAAADFFGARLMYVEWFDLPPGFCGRLVYDTGGGPVDKGWSQLAVYHFRVNYSGDLPHTDCITIKARDSYLMSPSGSAQWTADPDICYSFTIVSNSPPGVAITSSVDGGACGQGFTVNLVATATDTDGSVTGVEFFDGAVKLGSGVAGGGTWALGWDTTAAALGAHSITARATDNWGAAATSGPVSIVVCIPGDGNANGVVDGLDYNIWQNGYGQPAPTFSTGDYDNNGRVDGLDYGIWQNYYGTGATQVSGVPNGAAASEHATPAAGNAPRLIAVTPDPDTGKRPTRDAEGGTADSARAALAASAGQDELPQTSGPGVLSLTLVFDSSVEVGAGAVEVSGLKTGGHADYAQAYDAATKTLKLVWSSALPAGRYAVRVVADFVTGADGGAPLDGEVGDPADPTLPSGDGRPGGDARLEFTVE